MSDLVDQTGVPVATIRYYLSENLLPAPTRAQSNRFLYDERHVEIVRLIRLLRERRRLSIDAIREILPGLMPDLLGGEGPGAFRPEIFAAAVGAVTRPSMVDRITKAGLEAFARDGVSDVSVDEICRAVDIAKGTFYRHFSSKEALVAAVARRIPVEVAESLRTPAAFDRVLEPYLTVVLEIASLARRDRAGYRSTLSTLVSALGAALLVAEQAPDQLAAEATVLSAIGTAIGGIRSPQPEGVVDAPTESCEDGHVEQV